MSDKNTNTETVIDNEVGYWRDRCLAAEAEVKRLLTEVLELRESSEYAYVAAVSDMQGMFGGDGSNGKAMLESLRAVEVEKERDARVSELTSECRSLRERLKDACVERDAARAALKG